MKAKIYDLMMSNLEKIKLDSQRKKLISKARGRVLDIGAGTGVNFHLYGDLEVVALEPDTSMILEAKKKVEDRSIEIVKGSASEIPYEDNTFDTIIITLALCTVEDPKRVLEEVARVLKLDGRLLIMEHIRHKRPFLAKAQDNLTPTWKKFACGCHLNRDTLKVLEESGFEKIWLEYFWKDIFVVGEYRKK